jgi:hypothetical protein
MRRKRQIVIQTELLPPAPHTRKSDLEVLERLVVEKVNAILANREDVILQPFFNSKKVTEELRRQQTVPETRKWAFYFAKWGCLICGEKRTAHAGTGMCGRCKCRTQVRLRAILAEETREHVQPQFANSLEAIAKKALLKALPEEETETEEIRTKTPIRCDRH